MKHHFIQSLLAFAVMAFSGCASIAPPLVPTASPEESMGYIAGAFSRQGGGGFAFVLLNLETKREYGLSLGEDVLLSRDVGDQVSMIKVPPGRYVVANWYTYGTLNKAKNGTFPIRNQRLAQPFEVGAKSVVFLGKFAALTTVQGTVINWSIKPWPITPAEASQALSATYPSFTGLDLQCHLCSI